MVLLKLLTKLINRKCLLFHFFLTIHTPSPICAVPFVHLLWSAQHSLHTLVQPLWPTQYFSHPLPVSQHTPLPRPISSSSHVPGICNLLPASLLILVEGNWSHLTEIHGIQLTMATGTAGTAIFIALYDCTALWWTFTSQIATVSQGLPVTTKQHPCEEMPF